MKLHIFKKLTMFLAATAFIFILMSCEPTGDDIKQGNTDCIFPVDKEVEIAGKVWTTRNLDVDTFRNGDPIPQARTDAEWFAASENKQPAWCYSEKGPVYGKLYNWYAVSDPRGLAPLGWRIPTSADWDTMKARTGIDVEEGSKFLKNTTCWGSVNGTDGNGTNSLGFSAVPAGSRSAWGPYNDYVQGQDVSFWCSNEYDATEGNHLEIRIEHMDLPIMPALKGDGFSVRCIKEEPVDPNCKLPQNTEVKLGAQIWMTANLDVAKFRNGDLIVEAKTAQEWEKAGADGTPAWCYLDNDATLGKKYGKLYNWHAVMDPRGLAPTGWHVPTIEEWQTLVSNLGGAQSAALKLKNSTCWPTGENGTNESGFFAMPAGLRYAGGAAFSGQGYDTRWYTSSRHTDGGGYWISIAAVAYWDYFLPENKPSGYSVRCVKD